MSPGLQVLGQRSAAYTPEFTYVKGAYRIGTEKVTYYSVTMRVDEAVHSLTLARDVVLDPKAPIRMAELFQRELDKKRAEEEIAGYLRQPKQPKFFNSITAVVLPLDPINDRLLAHRYEDLPHRPRIPDDADFETTDIGPVRIKRVKGDTGVGYISWDSRLARAVIVDGQHRFYAMDYLLRETDFPYRSDLAETTISVLLLVLDKRAGFETANEDQSSVIQTCRALFIDLNKYAKGVSKARQYLLDDRDITAVCMRHILSEEVGGDTSNVTTRVAATGRLPMALVDWSSEEAQFSKDLYLTTTLTLYELTQTALGVALPPVLTDYPAQRDYLSKLVARLDLDGSNDFNEASLLREVDLAEHRAMPFALGNEDTAAAAEGFRLTVGSMVVSLLTGMTPYAELIKRYEQAELLGGQFEQWLGLDQPGKKAFVQELQLDPGPTALEISKDVKTTFRMAYQVVFQKGFLAALVESDRFRPHVMAHWGRAATESRAEFNMAWMQRFNSVFAGRLGGVEAWRGAGITATDTISVTSQRAIAGFVVCAMLAPLEAWAGRSEEDVVADARVWLEEAWAKSGGGRPAHSIDGLYKVGSAWRKTVATYVKTQFRLREEERTPDDHDIIDFGARQLARLALPVVESTAEIVDE